MGAGRRLAGQEFRRAGLTFVPITEDECALPARLFATKAEPMSDDEETGLARPQRRLLRRIFNGRIVPIVADEKTFLTYKDATRYLQSLPPEAREAAYLAMKTAAS